LPRTDVSSVYIHAQHKYVYARMVFLIQSGSSVWQRIGDYLPCQPCSSSSSSFFPLLPSASFFFFRLHLCGCSRAHVEAASSRENVHSPKTGRKRTRMARYWTANSVVPSSIALLRILRTANTQWRVIVTSRQRGRTTSDICLSLPEKFIRPRTHPAATCPCTKRLEHAS
jgi:hypothetical protein